MIINGSHYSNEEFHKNLILYRAHLPCWLPGYFILRFLGRLAEADSVNKRETLLRIAFPTDERSKNKFELLFSGPDILDNWKKEKKIFVKIDLTGEPDEDKKRIEFIKNKARELKYTYDTIHILKVHFTEDNTYGQFVELVNIMNKDRHKRYTFYKDDFYILGETPPEQIDLR